MTRDTIHLGWVGAAFLVLAIALGYRYTFRHPEKKPVMAKRWLTLRIEGIPTNKLEQAFERDFGSIVEQDPELKHASTAPKQHYLVPRNQKVACATATVYTSIPAKELVKKLHKAGSSFPYRFDLSFSGITPLYEGHGHVDAE